MAFIVGSDTAVATFIAHVLPIRGNRAISILAGKRFAAVPGVVRCGVQTGLGIIRDAVVVNFYDISNRVPFLPLRSRIAISITIFVRIIAPVVTLLRVQFGVICVIVAARTSY